MKREKRKVVEKDAAREVKAALGGGLHFRGSAKYKKHPLLSRSEKSGPDIHTGMRLVLAHDQAMERVGYYLAELIDFDDNAGYWGSDTDLFCRIIKASNDKMPEKTGRIVLARWPANRWYIKYMVVSFDPSFFPGNQRIAIP